MQLERAAREFAKLKLPETLAGAERVVFCGMGGSGIGAAVACDLPPEWVRKPLFVMDGYELPSFVDERTLVVPVSYSGDTEEVLSCFRQALDRNAPVVAVAGGGALAEEAARAGIPVYRFDYQSQPRDAFGFLFSPLVAILERAGVITQAQADLSPAMKAVEAATGGYAPEVSTSANRAKQLAYRLFDRVPFMVGGKVMSGVARRWKNQINEHAKSMAWFDTLPEANHNTVEGFRWPSRTKDDALVLMLWSGFEHERVQLRQKLLVQNFKDEHIEIEEVMAQGDDLWSQKLSALTLGDWTSYYLALLYRTDPEDIPVIKKLKGKLAA